MPNIPDDLMDARQWAKKFTNVYGTTNPITEDTLFVWVANIMMCGYDCANVGRDAEVEQLKAEIATLKFNQSFESKLNE